MIENTLTDSHGRTIRDLRVSVTDRCNFRCMYCLPETEAAANFYRGRWGQFETKPIHRQWAPKSQILNFEEIERIVCLAVELGVEKIRLTGGEPLLRQQLEVLVAQISRIPGIKDLAMTTNGFLFKEKATALKAAGLRRISFSLDSLNRENFRKMTGRDGLGEVLEGIALARDLHLSPVKVNAVIIRGINDHELEGLAEFGAREGLSMRFIEFMPLDSARAWQRDFVVPGTEILQRLKQSFSLQPLSPSRKAETAKKWAIEGTGGEIGIIAPVSEPFCGHCDRLRLTADGKLRTCLFSHTEHDLRPFLRKGAEDDQIKRYMQDVVWQKEPGHRINQPEFIPPQRSMSCIGG